MPEWVTIILTAFVSLCTAAISSSGLWAHVDKKLDKKFKRIESRNERETAMSEMLMGLGHDAILRKGGEYIHRGYITPEEYKDLDDYLYKPYIKLNGNGSAERIMNEIKKLPSYQKEE